MEFNEFKLFALAFCHKGGIPGNFVRFRNDQDKGMFIAYIGDDRITGNPVSRSLSIRSNGRTYMVHT